MMFDFTDKRLLGERQVRCEVIFLRLWTYKGKDRKPVHGSSETEGLFWEGKLILSGINEDISALLLIHSKPSERETNKQFSPDAAYIFASFRSWRAL